MTSGWDGNFGLTKTETLSIGMTSDPPNYPDHPRRMAGASGGFLNQDFVTCGGIDAVEGVEDKCFKLGSVEPFATMMKKRADAASIVLEPGKLWILGGWDENLNELSSTEYIFSDGRNEEGPPMPITHSQHALADHAMVKINDTTSFLVGGWTGSYYSKRTWYYNGNWHRGPDLKKGRSGHSVGIIRDSVTDQVYLVVAGGNFPPINDVEIISVTGTAWETGNLL